MTNRRIITPTMTPYLRDQIVSASPVQLIIILYDGLIRFLTSASEGFNKKDPGERFETVNNNLLRAQAIITELDASLDMERGGDVARQLREIYSFLDQKLTESNISKDPSMILKLVTLVSELRDSWCQMVANQNATAEVQDEVGAPG